LDETIHFPENAVEEMMAGDSHTENSQLRGIIVDYGEVLCLKPGDGDLARMADIFGISPALFATRYDKNRRAYDRGDLTPDEYWRSFVDGQTKPLNPQQISTLRTWDVEMWSHTNPVMIGWLEAMPRAGLATALLSNMHIDMVAKVRREFSWVQSLKFAAFSHELRLAKPEAEIYEYCLQGLGTRAEETLFIDDREVNIQAAQGLGIRTIRFESVAQLHTELRTMGFPVLPILRSASRARQ
jgi:putative hydrolase of the HAD superfamily